MKSIFLLISVWILAIESFGQDNVGITDLQRLTDELITPDDGDLNYEDLYENATQILTSPLDLNTVSAEELMTLHILSDQQIENFISYRKEQGQFMDVYELQVIPGMDTSAISKLLPFISVKDPSTRLNTSLLRRMFSTGNTYLVTRYERTLETKLGFKTLANSGSAFRGSADKIYFRLRTAMAGDFSVGITAEKDAGEKLGFDARTHQLGFDFTSYHFQLRNKGKVKNFILGDFQAQFGQGLTFGGAFGLGKGGQSISTMRKSNVGFQPYTSIHEGAYQRGLAATFYPLTGFGVSVFYSVVRRDASFESTDQMLTVTSLQNTGYHRTAREWLNRKKITEQNSGMVIHLEKGRFDAGGIINIIHFEVPIKKTPTPYNQFSFSGTTNLNAGIFFNYRLANISFFSEGARSLGGGPGIVGGILVSAHPRLEVGILYRNYSRSFYTFYSNAFSENTQPQNENGVYWSWRYRWNRQYSFNGYVDLFTFPWLGFRRYAPSHGYEWLLRSNYEPSRRVSMFVQVREESKEVNLSGTTNLYPVGIRVRRNVSLHCDYFAGRHVRLKSRIQYNAQDFDERVTEGWAVAQDITIKLGKFQLSGRHALFDTEHYDNRQYIYESDAWSAYSLPAYSGTGVRNYALVEYMATKNLTIWLRYARTYLINSAQIGSGQDIIDGNTRNDVKFQARIKF